MVSPLLSQSEMHSLGMKLHDLSNFLGVLSGTVLDLPDDQPLERTEGDEAETAVRTLRTISRGLESLVDRTSVPF